MSGTVSRTTDAHAAVRLAIHERQFEHAKRLLEQRLTRCPDDVDALCLSALAHWRSQGDLAAAQVHLARARSLRPDDASVLTLCAEFALHLGQIDTVFALAEKALAIDENKTAALIVLARADARRVTDAILHKMICLTKAASTNRNTLRFLHNAIGRVFDARCDYDSAFHHFYRSNQLAVGKYDPLFEEKRLVEARRLFTPEFFNERPGHGIRNSGCVFMTGLPRTGSTLIEQLLIAHPSFTSCGESDAGLEIDRALRRKLSQAAEQAWSCAHLESLTAADARNAAEAYLAITAKQMGAREADNKILRRVDKKLSNFLQSGLIRLMFPDAIFLRVHRHPLDVCLSCYTQGFDGHYYANDLEALGHFYLLHQDYVRLWSERFPDEEGHLSYEDYVDSPEHHARAVLDRLGVEWNEACLKPHRATRFVATSSAAQIRAPVHKKAVHRWRNYEQHLQPLIRQLGGLDRIEEMPAIYS